MESMKDLDKNSKVKTIGDYALGSTLGEGTFGKVKRGVNLRTKQQVAVKIIDKLTVRQQNMGSQIKREVNIMKQLGLKKGSSNFVRLYDVLASKSKIYLVMELVEGTDKISIMPLRFKPLIQPHFALLYIFV